MALSRQARELHRSRCEAQSRREAWADFLGRWHWHCFATLTFAQDVGPGRAERAWLDWLSYVELRQVGGTVRWVRADELTKRGRVHFHALLGHPFLAEVASFRALWGAWFRANGRAKVEVPREAMSVQDYCAKYVTKGGELTLSPGLGSREPQGSLLGVAAGVVRGTRTARPRASSVQPGAS